MHKHNMLQSDNEIHWNMKDAMKAMKDVRGSGADSILMNSSILQKKNNKNKYTRALKHKTNETQKRRTDKLKECCEYIRRQTKNIYTRAHPRTRAHIHMNV